MYYFLIIQIQLLQVLKLGILSKSARQSEALTGTGLE